MTETYVVKFWYINYEGYLRQGKEEFYCNSKGKHKEIERYAKNALSKHLKDVRIISVIYV